MRASALVKELQYIIATDGDYEINISCAKGPNDDPNQSYLMSSPVFVVVEEYEEAKEISIRDWPY